MVLGYDISARLLLTLKQATLYASGHHAGAIGGVFGSAAASSALLKLDARKVRYVLSLCAEHAAGTYNILRDSQHIEKAYVQGGMPGHNGVACALMVAHGFTGVDDVFTGDRDFITTFSKDADRSQLTHALGKDYEILRCAIKRWTVGGPIQGSLQVLYEIMREHGVQADNVEKLVARMPDKELTVVDNRDMPDICVQHLLAIMLLDGTLTFKAAHDYARMHDPKVLALRKRMEMVGDPALTDAMRRWRCVMEITLKDGREINHQTMAAKGSYENPQSREEEQEKALDLIAPVLTKRRAQALLARLWDIDRIKDVRELRKLVSA
jgi:2-methylcitrate dehydratase PrpD